MVRCRVGLIVRESRESEQGDLIGRERSERAEGKDCRSCYSREHLKTAEGAK